MQELFESTQFRVLNTTAAAWVFSTAPWLIEVEGTCLFYAGVQMQHILGTSRTLKCACRGRIGNYFQANALIVWPHIFVGLPT